MTDEEALGARHRISRRLGSRPSPALLYTLRSFAEGPMDKPAWDAWWIENAEFVAREVSRRDYLGLKFKPMEFAREILEDFGVEFEPDWTRCGVCGVTVSTLVPATRTALEFGKPVEKRWVWNPVACPHVAGIIVDFYFPPEEEKFDRSGVCSVRVLPSSTLTTAMGNFNIYIDGNTVYIPEANRHFTLEQDFWVEPGEHRIVARECEIRKPDRKESNALWFTAESGGTLLFDLDEIQGRLTLRLVE